MKSTHLLQTIDTHTAGCPTRSLYSGFPLIPGNSLQEKQEFFQKNYDWIRQAIMKEPRGHVDMCGTIWVPPVHPQAHMGVMFINTVGYLAMCGHSTIGAVTALVESGRVPITGEETEVVLETPAGLVRTKVQINDGKATSVSFRNVPSFLFESGTAQVPGFGDIKYDVAYGGNQYAITEASAFNLELKPERLDDILEAALAFARVICEKVKFQHPERPYIKGINHVEFTAPPLSPTATHRNTVVILPEDLENGLPAYDRSPCGTGTSARLAALYAHGEVGLNEEIVQESIISTQFRGKIVEEVTIGEFKGGIPEISGQAFVTGVHSFLIDDSDQLKNGFLVG